MGPILKQFPFTVVGLATIAALLVVELGQVSVASPVHVLSRVLIAPIWTVRTITMFLLVSVYGDPRSVPKLIAIFAQPFVILPYLAADYVLYRIRQVG